jgi:uncharacterized membrane protein
VARMTMVTGLILIGIALGGYVPTGALTALIPAAFGILLLALGALARRSDLRMHAMHGAVLIGLFGFLAAGYRVVNTALSGTIALPLAFAMQICMAATCGVFVALCVKSFIDARRARKASEEAKM